MAPKINDSQKIEKLTCSAYIIPTEEPESDGTLKWNSTTLVLVEINAGGKNGIGYTYGDASIAGFIHKNFQKLLLGRNALDIPALWNCMVHSIRNEGGWGMAMMAISAIDIALWDLKAKILELSLSNLLGKARTAVPVYASGAFTSYSSECLKAQMEIWANEGFTQMKMKIGRNWEEDLARVKLARDCIKPENELFVDANGAYDIKTALKLSESFANYGVTWFEEPVPSSNLEGLAFLRNHAPAKMNIAAGEYGYGVHYFYEMLKSGSVDVLQADATRCGGITGFLKAGNLAFALQIPFSFHCASAVHIHAAAALPSFYIGEYFYDHARIEQLLFEGAQKPIEGKIAPDWSRNGLGIEWKSNDAAPFKV
ncbi:MAG TPA: enolase C-terminal domain-like protein [Salinimicrobium sp.]|nr:enolase C-terminal domain-like protein [Salinimicrobium sp.]